MTKVQKKLLDQVSKIPSQIPFFVANFDITLCMIFTKRIREVLCRNLDLSSNFQLKPPFLTTYRQTDQVPKTILRGSETFRSGEIGKRTLAFILSICDHAFLHIRMCSLTMLSFEYVIISSDFRVE